MTYPREVLPIKALFESATRLQRYAWSSPTLTSWSSTAAHALNVAIVLPFVLTRLPAGDIALWYLFMSILTLQVFFDFAFSLTFSRALSFAMGGASVEEMSDLTTVAQRPASGPNWTAADAIAGTMPALYARGAIVLFGVLATFGTAAVYRPIQNASSPTQAWVAWALVVITTTVAFRGIAFSAYLLGMNEVPLLKRWEATIAFSAAIGSAIVLAAGGGLLALVTLNLLRTVITVTVNRMLARGVAGGRLAGIAPRLDAGVVRSLWPASWRAGVGMIFADGVVLLSGIVFAQLAGPAALATYLLGIRLIQNVREISQAPFYSHLPRFARLRAEGKLEEQAAAARRAMTLSYWTFVTAFAVLGFAGDALLRAIHSNAAFPDRLMWSLLGLAYLAERYGGMHIQLYSTTNRIIWHIANGLAGSAFVLTSVALFHVAGVYAFGLGLLVANAGVYVWISASRSYRALGTGFWSYEKRAFIPALAAHCAVIAALLASR